MLFMKISPILSNRSFRYTGSILLLTSLFVTFFIGCKSLQYSENLKNRLMDPHIREGQFAIGQETMACYLNDYLIAGVDISKVDTSRSQAFNALLIELGLERIIDTSPFHEPQTFICYRKRDNDPFLIEEDKIIETLRYLYGDSFGPVVLNELKRLQGALQNKLIVKLNQETANDAARNIFEKYGAEDFTFMVDQQAYLVEFPKDWGYKLIDIGKRMLEDEQISYVENSINTIPRR